jgi:hypothetical protein
MINGRTALSEEEASAYTIKHETHAIWSRASKGADQVI